MRTVFYGDGVTSARSRIYRGAAAVVAVLAVPSIAVAGDRTWTTDGDFAAGASTDLVIGGDAITVAIDGVGTPDASIAWWNTAWGQRRCLEVINNETTALTEFQISFEIDTATPVAGGRMSATGDDIRFIAADGLTELDYWVEGPIDDPATTIWVQTDTLPAGPSTMCMYYDNAGAPAASDIYTPFSYSTPQARYVAVSETQVNQPIAVTSYVDDNLISDGVTSVTLPAGGTHTFLGAGHTAATVVTATGPIAVQGTGNNSDTYVPMAFAGTEFVVSSDRNANRVSVYAPFADAAVVIEHSGTTTNVTVPVGTSVSVAADVTSNTQSAVVTSDEPVLVTHQASGSYDALVVVPASDASLYGIRSSLHNTGFASDGTVVDVRESDGTTATISGDAGDAVNRGAGGVRGTGPAVIATPTSGGPIGSAQQADADGVESTAYWPRSEHNVVYRTPVNIDYIAFACPFQTTGGVDSDGTTLDCNGTGGTGFPGKALDSTGATAGALYQSLDGTPFYVYAEDDANDDENNILGPKQARLATTNPPTLTIGAEQSRYLTAATWTSDLEDTGCGSFFGELSWNPVARPAGTGLAFQVATAASASGPFDFLGPDGTPGSDYVDGSGTALPTVHDGDRFIQVRANLTSSGDRLQAPTVTDVEVDWQTENGISGTLFADLDADGTIDTGDNGVGGVDVTLWRDQGDGTFDPGTDIDVTTVVSGGDGTYSFDNRPPGTYFVVADESQLPSGFRTPGTTPNPAGPLLLDDCEALTADFGWEPSRTITATVFSDLDGDGVRSPDDIALAGVAVDLWLDDGDGIFDEATDDRVRIRATDATGTSVFDELPLGSYFVDVSRTPAGHRDPATSANPAGPFVLVDGGGPLVSIGFEPFGGLAGTAFVDDNGDGTMQSTEEPVGALFVGIYRDDGDGVFDTATDVIVTVVQTTPDGGYVAPNLDPGPYVLVPFDSPIPGVTIAPVFAAVTASGTTVADLPFERGGSISGAVIFDADGDGARDDGSTPLTGLPVFLHRDDGDNSFDPDDDPVVGVAVSGDDGGFRFEDLAAERYFVRVGTTTFLVDSGVRLIGENPLGPVEPGTADLLFAFDPRGVELPATGTGTLRLLAGAIIALLAGVMLLRLSRRRAAW